MKKWEVDEDGEDRISADTPRRLTNRERFHKTGEQSLEQREPGEGIGHIEQNELERQAAARSCGL